MFSFFVVEKYKSCLQKYFIIVLYSLQLNTVLYHMYSVASVTDAMVAVSIHDSSKHDRSKLREKYKYK